MEATVEAGDSIKKTVTPFSRLFALLTCEFQQVFDLSSCCMRCCPRGTVTLEQYSQIEDLVDVFCRPFGNYGALIRCEVNESLGVKKPKRFPSGRSTHACGGRDLVFGKSTGGRKTSAENSRSDYLIGFFNSAHVGMGPLKAATVVDS